ncbi:hypothetical protein HBH70_137450 [Parastagonospora nodorum]|nr:hypothetical protein HBH51_129830 [Parastagonospora nodorum]KAH3989341.1 hypothetical protein HBH52_012130 [Parastagonospora nodorum]KAH4026279.1 hypothetical protein HBI09_150900 [Parastagonospora nodorum]KAH4056876.1 hypothetical protein HBH49_038490 [Parastagonospora nodorum]KAH4197342.1 hypothetical protein HBH42_055830 [Parastagonospora nodorum]
MHVRSCRSPIACPAGPGGGVEISSLISCKCRSTTNSIPEAGNPKPTGLQRTRSARLRLYIFLQPWAAHVGPRDVFRRFRGSCEAVRWCWE